MSEKELYIFPDKEMYHSPPEWKSDDYYIVNRTTTMHELLLRYSPEEAKEILDAYLNVLAS